MKYILLASMLLFIGCGNTSRTTEKVPEGMPLGTNINMSTGGDGSLQYSYADNGSVVVTCADGSDCGDINVNMGDGYVENNHATSKTGGYVDEYGNPTCGGGYQMQCPEGFIWCPVENKCIPST